MKMKKNTVMMKTRGIIDMMEVYDKVRSVPENAQKTITGGRLNGKTDINPMWRIKTLTEVFGMCGVGWYYDVLDKRLEKADSGEVAAFVDIHLYVSTGDGQWSKPIFGTGGSMFIAKDKNGLYTSDECFKMALTDAISVSCKALGVGADIYWDKDKTKYDRPEEQNQEEKKQGVAPTENRITKVQIDHIMSFVNESNKDNLKEIMTKHGVDKLANMPISKFDQIFKEFVENGLPFDLG